MTTSTPLPLADITTYSGAAAQRRQAGEARSCPATSGNRTRLSIPLSPQVGTGINTAMREARGGRAATAAGVIDPTFPDPWMSGRDSDRMGTGEPLPDTG